MKINLQNNLNFQKKLIAHGGILKFHKPSDVEIYELESPQDEKYMEEIKNSHAWKNGLYTFNIPFVLKNNSGMWATTKCYVQEDKKGNCLGYAVVDEYPDWDEIIFIETVPQARHKNKNRTKKYIGETMMNFLAQNTLNKGKDVLVVNNPVKKVLPFYTENCHCKETESKFVYLDELNTLKLALQNMEHTEKAIDFEA